MNKALSRSLVLASLLAVAIAVPAESAAGQAEVRLAPLGASYAPPPLGRNQGWLTITNRDWKPYTVTVSGRGRMSIAQGALPRGTVVRSGSSVTIAVDRDNWEIYGASGDELRCRVREGRTSTISLEPFGSVNGTGLRGVSNDGDRVRTEVLFESYAPPVVVQRPPVIVQPAPPPVIVQPPPPPVIVHTPPPVVVQRPPVVVMPPPPPPPPPHHGRPTHRPPGHRPGPDRDRGGWGFTFGFSSR